MLQYIQNQWAKGRKIYGKRSWRETRRVVLHTVRSISRGQQMNRLENYFANFKPDRGNYTKDGNLITSKVGIYGANSNGLYDMAGNVAEWTSTIYTEAGVDAMNDFNPQLDYKAAREDPYRLKKKSVRGGSWKDPESYIRSAWRTWEYQNQPRSYIGFRCVRSLASSSSEAAKENKKSSKKKRRS